MNRETIIDILVNDDFSTIEEDIITTRGSAYLYDILMSGHKGYDNMTDEELFKEFKERQVNFKL